jgi:hypothetical protein
MATGRLEMEMGLICEGIVKRCSPAGIYIRSSGMGVRVYMMKTVRQDNKGYEMKQAAETRDSIPRVGSSALCTEGLYP